MSGALSRRLGVVAIPLEWLARPWADHIQPGDPGRGPIGRIRVLAVESTAELNIQGLVKILFESENGMLVPAGGCAPYYRFCPEGK
jgi:hypothetical protein